MLYISIGSITPEPSIETVISPFDTSTVFIEAIGFLLKIFLYPIIPPKITNTITDNIINFLLVILNLMYLFDCSIRILLIIINTINYILGTKCVRNVLIYGQKIIILV
jgi:hypothetical protein